MLGPESGHLLLHLPSLRKDNSSNIDIPGAPACAVSFPTRSSHLDVRYPSSQNTLLKTLRSYICRVSLLESIPHRLETRVWAGELCRCTFLTLCLVQPGHFSPCCMPSLIPFSRDWVLVLQDI